MRNRVLVAGIGNIFQADDGFGVEVVQRLAARPLPSEVDVVDFGIRGFDLAFALLDGVHEHVFLVDLVKRGGRPGTLYLIEPEVSQLDLSDPSGAQDLVTQTHGMDPARVLSWIQASGGNISNIRLVGCEPEALGSEEDVSVGLSAPVRDAVDQAVAMLEKLIDGALSTCMN